VVIDRGRKPLKIRPLQKLHDWLTGKSTLTDEEVKRQLFKDFPMLEGLANGDIVRIGRKDFDVLIEGGRQLADLRAAHNGYKREIRELQESLEFYGNRGHLLPEPEAWRFGNGVARQQPGSKTILFVEDGERARAALNPGAAAASTEAFYQAAVGNAALCPALVFGTWPCGLPAGHEGKCAVLTKN
jgi:hypothetical protein